MEEKYQQIIAKGDTEAERIAQIFVNKQSKQQDKIISGLVLALIISLIMGCTMFFGAIWFVSNYEIKTETTTYETGGDIVEGSQYKDFATHNERMIDDGSQKN